MNIFESLENLNVSEECFNDIVGIVEELITENVRSMFDLPQQELKKLYKKHFPQSKVPNKKDMIKLSNKLDDIKDEDAHNFTISKQGGHPKNYKYHPKSLTKPGRLHPEAFPGRRMEKSPNFYASGSPLEDKTDTFAPRKLIDDWAQKAVDKAKKRKGI